MCNNLNNFGDVTEIESIAKNYSVVHKNIIQFSVLLNSTKFIDIVKGFLI